MGEPEPKTKFQAWRLTNELAIDDVSGLTGLSPSYVYRVDRGERTLPPLTKVKVARRLGVPVRVLFDIEDIAEGAA
jgi:transcriptional regulator with XRE-family HTH domain